ncbi:malonate decarboxylase holo-ACP synthase [Thermolongibacillus altinsuensis]|uniref:malonate decarboxylase holo-ACP synthase n=1 Tax=Thermolongibacillus altinsuensis TaxID=575256 RepID=UPI00242A31FD|nr:malonate decarboxylase holo-ACP synthase [Thermolongibacillus altinsuensis]GMB08080.1 malonate decarboxylase holo-ACP synthase [Thermolongibacillus altinsuensis]
MELNPHDLLRIKDRSSLIIDGQEPEWVAAALTLAPYVVVRRAPIEKGYIPVGIRGHHRHERLAAFLHKDDVGDTITPQQLVVQKQWRKSLRYHQLQVLQALDDINEIFTFYRFVWGPVGSVGFELVTGVPTVKDTSDLDIVVLLSCFPSVKTAQQLVTELTCLPIRVDVQLETPLGAVSLVEYSHGKERILLKSIHGPQLIWHPSK